ncbi:hypothetical protein [Aliarcobacter butzleri]|nr:hypothetical protein [Aliarcobacter butzleri]MCT7569053.1 hypothetical protein [Aliarcobacter butzleri]
MAIKLDEVNKILYAYDIKNDIVDENSKEILAYILIILQMKKMNI